MIVDGKIATDCTEESVSLRLTIAELEAENRRLRQRLERRGPVRQSMADEHEFPGAAIGETQYVLSHLVDFLPDPTFAINPRREVIAWNKAMEELTGIDAEDILGKGDREYALPFYGVRRPLLVDLVFEAGLEVEHTYSFVQRQKDVLAAETGQMLFVNGRGLYLKAKASPIYDREGNLIGAIESLQDITERKLAEDLRESEERFRFMAENTGDVLYRLNYDSMRYDYLSPAVKQLTGYWADEIMTFGFSRLVKEIEMPGVEHVSVDRLIQNRREGEVREYQADYQICTRSGELKWVRDHSFPWCDESGMLIGSVGILSDVTKRKQTEDALRESEKRFRLLVEKAPLGISLRNCDLTFEYLNPRFTEILGYTLDDLPGEREWFEKASPQPDCRTDGVGPEKKDPPGSPEFGTVEDRTVTVSCKDGQSKVVHVRSVLMDDGRQLCTYQDITDHRKLEAHLRQVHKMEAIGTLAGGIAHDFNNMLAAIMGYAEMTLANVAQGSLAERNLEQILKAGHRAKNLIRQILMFTHEGEKEFQKVEIWPVVKEALKLLRASIPKTVEISQNNRLTSDGVALADPTQIHQVLMNLCTNAAYAMRERGGVLEVSLADGDPRTETLSVYSKLRDVPYMKITVSDTGCGIDPAIIDRVFDPFFTTKGPGQGTGMGLSVVHGIVKSHGGAVGVNSSPGKGTTFSVYLPRLKEKAPAERNLPCPLPRGSGRILFVDDEETLADLGKEMLTDLGYEVVSLTCSREALVVFRAQPAWFDLVFTDYTMPQMTGTELAQRILSLRPDVPVVLCTGYSEAITEQMAREAGVTAFVMKPLSLREIAEVVSKALGASRQDGRGAE